MRLDLDPELGRTLRIGWMELSGLDPEGDPGTAQAALIAVAAQWRDRAGDRPPGEIPEVRRSRALYKAIGIDPTRHRPSCEALLRRALKDKPLPRVHPVVDAVNADSLREQVSMGLYDASRIRGDRVEIRIGREGEEYEGIGRGTIHVSGRICLCDEAGPFGNPTADSDRTKVSASTTAVCLATFHPVEVAESDVTRVSEAVAEQIRCVAGGEIVERLVLGGGPA